jgi:hypothetical protein
MTTLIASTSTIHTDWRLLTDNGRVVHLEHDQTVLACCADWRQVEANPTRHVGRIRRSAVHTSCHLQAAREGRATSAGLTNASAASEPAAATAAAALRAHVIAARQQSTEA